MLAGLDPDSDASELQQYQFEPKRYIVEKLKWEPWSGDDEHPGQEQVIEAYTLALRQLHERIKFEHGEPYDATIWQPGTIIKNRFRIEAGHTVGKTKLASGLVSHFFDCFLPSIVYCFAPTGDQINKLLFKELRADREGKDLPGRVLETPEIKHKGNHFVKGLATNDANGRGTERVQGQHGKYLMFVLDEAEGIPDFVYNAIESMASGGIVIILMLANPRTQSSRFYKQRTKPTVASFRISCVYHPNVLADKEVVPGAVRRDYVTSMALEHCAIVEQHDHDNHTFELPWQPGVIYQPDQEFLFRVLGIPPANVSDKTLITTGRYEAATKRLHGTGDPTAIRMGADVARWGKDMGTLYIEHNGTVWRAAQFAKQDTVVYVQRIKEEALKLKTEETTSLHVRIDGGGGFGGGVIDQLERDAELIAAFPDFQVLEVNNNASPYSPRAYYDLVTEMYATAAERLNALAIRNPPDTLQEDLCDRQYDWKLLHGLAVRVLEEKEKFKKRIHRSPDDGDGFVLAVAPDYLFGKQVLWGSG